jgi:hypothetical protein
MPAIIHASQPAGITINSRGIAQSASATSAAGASPASSLSSRSRSHPEQPRFIAESPPQNEQSKTTVSNSSANSDSNQNRPRSFLESEEYTRQALSSPDLHHTLGRRIALPSPTTSPNTSAPTTPTSTPPTSTTPPENGTWGWGIILKEREEK